MGFEISFGYGVTTQILLTRSPAYMDFLHENNHFLCSISYRQVCYEDSRAVHVYFSLYIERYLVTPKIYFCILYTRLKTYHDFFK